MGVPTAVWLADDDGGGGAPRPKPKARPDKVASRQLNIVAHPDDDLYFLNPDVQQAILEGDEVTGVCVTCGETDGKNVRDGDKTPVPVDFPKYSAARQTGLRAAYAEMAVGDRKSPWSREALPLPGGRVADLSTLQAAPHVRLVFLNLWQDGTRSGVPGPRPRELWAGAAGTIPTMTYKSGPSTTSYAYDRAGLIEVLAALIERYQPSVIRTMDPDPDYLKHNNADHATRQHADFGDYADHQDHSAIAMFSWAAIQQVNSRAAGAAAGPAVESYRGYVNERWPYTLDEAAFREKVRLLGIYGWTDGKSCGDPYGCGDLKVADGAPGTGWGQSTTHRYPGDTSWLRTAPDGRQAAFAVLGGQAVVWSAAPAGAFAAPVPLGGGPLLPQVAAACTPDGRFVVFGLRMHLEAASPGGQRRSLVFAEQTGPGGRFSDWTDLGNPADGIQLDANRARSVGTPSAVALADGGIQVFVRNTGTGLSTRYRPRGGTWGPWTDLRGGAIQDGIAAVADADGRIEVFGSRKDGIARWSQAVPGGPFTFGRLDVPAPAGPPVALRGSDDRLRLAVRQPQTTQVLVYAQRKPGGDWDPKPSALGGPGGFGPVAAVHRDDRTVVATRNDAGNVSVGQHRGNGNADASWAPGGPALLHSPSVTLAPDGGFTVALLGVDGRLYTSRSLRTDGSAEMTPWTAAG
ncbi:PIG-L family deacetylase [Yinghuangia aomiensis]|uniref:PIG-L family deacetylase n=1 Tax=Yinghuangia aomiensis TaxID=676205 RepID=UPI0031E6C52F